MGDLALRTVVNGLALWLTALVVPGLHLGEESPQLANRLMTILLVALIFGLVNAIIKPALTLLGLPLIIVTLGLFTIVINAALLALTAWIAGGLGLDFTIDGFFWSAILGALVLSFISMLLSALVGEKIPVRR